MNRSIRNYEILGRHPRFWEDMAALVDMGWEALEAWEALGRNHAFFKFPSQETNKRRES